MLMALRAAGDNQPFPEVFKTEHDASESRNVVHTASTFFNMALTFGATNAARPAGVIMGKSRMASMGNPTIPGGIELRRCRQHVVDDDKHLAIVLDVDVATASRRRKSRLLLKHLGDVHVHHRIAFDKVAKLPDHRMKRRLLLLGRFNSAFQPVVELAQV